MTETENSTSRVECPAATDPAVRVLIGAAMLIGFAVYCFVDTEKPPEAWDAKHINEIASYVLHAYGPVAFGIPGLILLAWGIVFLRRKLVADEQGIGYAGKKSIPWAQIQKLDASKLKDKGILTLHDADGRTLVLDSWKLKNFKELVAFVEQHAPKSSSP